MLVMHGYPIKLIAGEMGIAPGTAAQYLAGLYKKLGLQTRGELARWGFHSLESRAKEAHPLDVTFVIEPATLAVCREFVHALQAMAAPKTEQLNRIEARLVALQGEVRQMEFTLDDLTNEVQNETTLVSSIQALLEKLFNLRNDPAKLSAAITTMRDNAAAISAALLANTPQDTPATA